MRRGVIDGIKFKLIRTSAAFIQFAAKNQYAFLIRPVNRFESEVFERKDGHDQTGVVIQGPLLSFSDVDDLAGFIQKLSSVIDSKYLVVSTWDNEFSRHLEKVVTCKILLNRDEGFENNFQRQLFSTTSGLIYLKSLNANVSIKVRIDQRIDPLSIPLLENVVLGDRYKGRLVFSSMNSYTHRFFGLSDMLNAGKTEDMLEFWSPNSCSDSFHTSTATIDLPFPSWINEIKPHWFESFLCIRFAYSRNVVFSDSPWDDYVNFLSNWVVLVDAEIINHKWSKIVSPLYSLTERSLYNPYVAPDDSEMTQALWFAITEGGYRPPKRNYDFEH
jgi:hypothetical protein